MAATTLATPSSNSTPIPSTSFSLRGKAPASMKVDTLPTISSASSSGCVRNKGGRIFSPVNEIGCFDFDRVLKSGDVLKRTRKTKSWKPAYLVLRPHTLSIYADRDGTKLRHRIQLQDLTAVARQRDPKKKAQHVFAVFSPRRNYHIDCTSDTEAQSWVEMIRSEARIIEEEDEAVALMSPSFDRGNRTDNNFFGQPSTGYQRHAETAGSTSASEVEPSPVNVVKVRSRQDAGTMHSATRMPSLGMHSSAEQASYSDFSDNGAMYPESTLSLSLPRNLEPDERARKVDEIYGSLPSASTSQRRPVAQRNPSAMSMKQQHQDSREERVVHSGHLLLLKSKGGVRQWKSVWAVLRPKSLALYKNEEEYEPLHIIPFRSILEAVDVDNSGRSRKHCFQVITEEKLVKFCARNEEEIFNWVGGFKALLARRREAERDRDRAKER